MTASTITVMIITAMMHVVTGIKIVKTQKYKSSVLSQASFTPIFPGDALSGPTFGLLSAAARYQNTHYTFT